MATTLTGAVSGGQPENWQKPVTSARSTSFSCSWAFTALDTAAPYVDCRGASRIRVLVDDHLASGYSFDIESSSDGTNSAGKETSGITTLEPLQFDGPFGWMRPSVSALTSGTLTITFFVLYD